MKIPESPKSLNWLRSTIEKDPQKFLREQNQHGPLIEGKYLHWEELKRRKVPDGLSHEEWWAQVWNSRNSSRNETPLVDKKGLPFTYTLSGPIPERLHEIDMSIGGTLGFYSQVRQPETKNKYLLSALIEEAITSSQLEGASSTRLVAKEMLRSKRRPRNRSEQMILNNYRTMKGLKDYKDRELSKELVFEIHQKICDLTLDVSDGAGRFRHESEGVQVCGEKGEVLHIPPPAQSLEKRMEAMCKFANGQGGNGFVHPLIRAIILHFWIGYDHPFVDGNGRTARTLFYWLMLRHGYWTFAYTSISQILNKAPALYSRAYLFAETDTNDLTYFILHQLEVIHMAGQELQKYVERKQEQQLNLQLKMKNMSGINPRQRSILSRALQHPHTIFTIQSHRQSQGASYQTARTDLLGLVKMNLFLQRKSGKRLEFTIAPDFEKKLEHFSLE